MWMVDAFKNIRITKEIVLDKFVFITQILTGFMYSDLRKMEEEEIEFLYKKAVQINEKNSGE